MKLSLKDQITEKQLSTPIDKLNSTKPYSIHFQARCEETDLASWMKGVNDFGDSLLGFAWPLMKR
ncbi:hypothetical protein O9992_00715 [Vibrio lentus]|nr:hypothetical protein [Vibrio lentus]